MVTYFDSTDKRLPFLSNNINMKTPDSWETVSLGYNDSPSISRPKPKVKLNLLEQQGSNVWIKEQNNGKGVAMFDATYSTYTEVEQKKHLEKNIIFGSYPNPCSNEVTIWFEPKKIEEINLTLYDISGKIIDFYKIKAISTHKQSLKIDISFLPTGSYLYSLTSETFSLSNKIIIIK